MISLKQRMIQSYQEFANLDPYYCSDCGRRNIDCICIDFEETPKIRFDTSDLPALDPFINKTNKPKLESLVEEVFVISEVKIPCYTCGAASQRLFQVKSTKIKLCINCAKEHVVGDTIS